MVEDDGFIIDLAPIPEPTHPMLDERGKFRPGNPGGHNPHATLQKRNRMLLLHAVTPDVLNKLVLNLVNIADDVKQRAADRVRATELLMRYAIGETHKHEVEVTHNTPAVGPIDLDTADVVALERIRAKLTAQTGQDAAGEIVVTEAASTTDTLRLLSDAKP